MPAPSPVRLVRIQQYEESATKPMLLSPHGVVTPHATLSKILNEPPVICGTVTNTNQVLFLVSIMYLWPFAFKLVVPRPFVYNDLIIVLR